MLILGLLILAGAVVVGVDGVVGNTGGAHLLTVGFNVFGYHLHGSSGRLFLAGLAVGAVGLLGLAMLIDGLRRAARVRRELSRVRRDARVQRPVVEPTAAATPERVVEPVATRSNKTPIWSSLTARRSTAPVVVSPGADDSGDSTDSLDSADSVDAESNERSTTGLSAK
jgi:hypothetical protein